jgi:hypothetical protein
VSEQPFLVPDDFRAFMQRVVAYLDTPGEDKFLDAEDALHDETGHGGRIEGDRYRFTYITRDGHYKWELPLREAAIRDIADGLLIEVMGVRRDVVRTKQRRPTGNALLVWGEYRDDALAIQSEEQLAAALDGLHAAAFDAPRILRLWSTMDDQCVAVLHHDLAALYVVESLDGYGSSTGDRTRTEAFQVTDHDGKPLTVPLADCIPWEIARRALLHFMHQGELAADVRLEGRIPSLLLMMGEVDREAAVAMRGDAPAELQRSSLPRMSTPVPHEVIAVDEPTTPTETGAVIPIPREQGSAWARRLIEVLYARELIELGKNGNLDEITYQLGGLLQAHGTEAQDSIDTAEWLANEIGAVRGISKLFATGGDLQIALRRSREA